MSERLSELQFAYSKAAYRQITDHLRKMILSGEYPPGYKLPSTQELTAIWKKQAPTIQAALDPLVKEGLLERCPGKGTFVRQREEKLTCVGIYDKATYGESQYSQALHAILREELTEAGIEMDVWIDPRPEAQWREPWQPLVKAAENREFQALIFVGTSVDLAPWQQKLPVPTAFHGGDLPNLVGFDLRQMAELGLVALARQGCRSVGLISPVFTEQDRSPHGWLEFYEHFSDCAQDLGLKVRNPWVRAPAGANDPRRWVAQEQFGYTEFLRLWSQPEKPDGLFIFPDTVARGAILALREQHVRVPEELKLVLHKNETIDLLCPVPATLLVNSERAVARALIEQVRKQFRGEQCESILVPHRLVAHSGNSQSETDQPTNEGNQS